MNIIDIILIAILGVSVLSGMQKGFLTSLLATFALVGAWFAARAVYPTLSQQFLASEFMKWLEANINFEGFLANLGDSAGKYVETISSGMNSIVDTLTMNNVPAAIVDSFKANTASFPTLTVAEYFSEITWQAIFNVISFSLIFAIAYAVLLLVVNLFNNVFRVPKLRGVDALLGGVLGAVRGYAVVCLVCAIIPMVFTALDSSVIDAILKDSSIGKFFISGDSVFKDLFRVGDQLAEIIKNLSLI
ncbi:MAG: CvpA family protein [Clostridia bacterium]|nr:CvpA family protein [Clostridia bacterium]